MLRTFKHHDIPKFWLWLIVAKCALAATSPCSQLQGARPKQELAYLQRDRAKLEPACIVYAIEQLGLRYHSIPGQHSAGAEAAADTLVTYLDFQAPGTENIGKGIVAFSRTHWIAEKYPAASSLVEIGKPSTPSLVRAIGSGVRSEILRKNALEVLFAIHSGNLAEAARELNSASRSASDNATAILLLNAAREFATKCPGERRSACEAALLER